MKKIAFLTLSKTCKLIAYGLIVLFLIDKIIYVITEIQKEPSFWHGVKRFWSILSPYDLLYSMQFWNFILIIIPSIGLIKLGDFLKNKAEYE